MALALLALLVAGSRGGGVSLDPVLSTVSGARYRRGTGDLAHEGSRDRSAQAIWATDAVEQHVSGKTREAHDPGDEGALGVLRCGRRPDCLHTTQDPLVRMDEGREGGEGGGRQDVLRGPGIRA
jgi:hypothetical protein